MPQFDSSTYPSQIFWLMISLGVFLTLMLLYIFPKLMSFLSYRETVLLNKQNIIEDLKSEQDALEALYTQKLLDNKMVLQTQMNDFITNLTVSYDASFKAYETHLNSEFKAYQLNLKSDDTQFESSIVATLNQTAPFIIQNFYGFLTQTKQVNSNEL